MKTKDKDLIIEAINLVTKSNSIEYAREVATQLIEEAWNDVVTFIPDSKTKPYLKQLAEFFIDRKV